MYTKLLTFEVIYSQYTAEHQMSHVKPWFSLCTSQVPLACLEKVYVYTFKIIFIKVIFCFLNTLIPVE